MTPSTTACPPTRMSSSLVLSAHAVAMSTRCLKYLKLKSVCLGLSCLLVVLSLESFDTAGRIDEFLLASKERMAFRADFEVDFRFRRTGLKGFAAGAFHDRIDVVRMDICFHEASQ